MQKKTYVIPESELLLVRFEENFLVSPGTEDGTPNDPPFLSPSRSTTDYHIERY